MSTSGFPSSGLSQLESAVQNAGQFLTDFQKLGTDLQGGKLGAAQQDMVTLSQDAQSASGNKYNHAADNNTLGAIEAGFQSLSQSLQGGDLNGAQQAYAQIVQATAASVAPAQNGQSGGGDFAAFIQMLQKLVAGSGNSGSSTSASATATQNAATAGNTSGMLMAISEETTESAGSDVATQEAELGQPPQLGYGTIGALAAVLKDLGAALGQGNLAGAQNSFAQFVQEAQSGNAAGIVGGDWIRSFLESQGSSGGIASGSVTQVNEKA